MKTKLISIFVEFAVLLTATTLVGQGKYFDTTLYSPALDKEK